MMTPYMESENGAIGVSSASPSLLLSDLSLSLSHYLSELLHTVHRLSTKTKGSKYVGFTISRGDGLPNRKVARDR
jgi:hypothetical protein